MAIMALVAASIIEPGLYFAMNTPPAGLGITMPNLHEMGGENAPIIMAQLKDVTAHAAADRQLLSRVPQSAADG